ncbi:Biotin transporter BioY [Nymphon striatum]|nr:Biotin transporter BioY [Nymphon striatum]
MSTSLTGQSFAVRTIADSSTKYLMYALYVAFGVCLITVAAKIKVPLWPNPTPVTLQTLAIFTIASAYGSRLAVATIMAYMIAGAAGMPVFTGTPEKGLGLAYMAGPTGGYLAGFVIMTYLTGLAADYGWSKNPFKMAGAMLTGETGQGHREHTSGKQLVNHLRDWVYFQVRCSTGLSQIALFHLSSTPEPDFTGFFVPVLDRPTWINNLIRAHCRIANKDYFVVRAIGVQNVPGRHALVVAALVILPDTFVKTIVEVKIFQVF